MRGRQSIRRFCRHNRQDRTLDETGAVGRRTRSPRSAIFVSEDGDYLIQIAGGVNLGFFRRHGRLPRTIDTTAARRAGTSTRTKSVPDNCASPNLRLPKITPRPLPIVVEARRVKQDRVIEETSPYWTARAGREGWVGMNAMDIPASEALPIRPDLALVFSPS